MPTYDFLCADCGVVFEGLVWRDERPACPECESERTGRQFSPPVPHGTPAQTASAGDVSLRRDAEALVESIKARIAAATGPAGAAQEERTGEGATTGDEPAAHRVRPVATAAPTALHAPGGTLRREAPEHWDLERDFERRQVEHLREIADKGERIVKLMARIDELEPLLDEVARRERELAEVGAQVDQLEEAGQVAAAALAATRAELAARVAEAGVLAERLDEAEQRIRDLEGDVSAVEQRGQQERARHAGELAGRDGRLEQARTEAAALENELRHHRDRADEAQHERDEVRAELESRTAALFKRDQLIQQADETIEGLSDELRERDRGLADAARRQERLQGEVEAREQQLGRRADEARALEERAAELDLQLAGVRAELEEARAELQEGAEARRELEQALTAAGGEIEQQRAKLRSSSNHLQLTQMVLEELKPMLESLETTLTPGSELGTVLAAVDAARGDGAVQVEPA